MDSVPTPASIAALVERVLGCLPSGPSDEPRRVEAVVRASGLLANSESFLAGFDDTWRASARYGRVLTDRRLFQYRDRTSTDLVALPAVAHVIVRRIWYPSAGLLRRGEAFGAGPVVILRCRFVDRDGRTTRVRVQSHAATLLPYVTALAERFAGRFEVARTLPGL